MRGIMKFLWSISSLGPLAYEFQIDFIGGIYGILTKLGTSFWSFDFFVIHMICLMLLVTENNPRMITLWSFWKNFSLGNDLRSVGYYHFILHIGQLLTDLLTTFHNFDLHRSHKKFLDGWNMFHKLELSNHHPMESKWINMSFELDVQRVSIQCNISFFCLRLLLKWHDFSSISFLGTSITFSLFSRCHNWLWHVYFKIEAQWNFPKLRTETKTEKVNRTQFRS